MNQLKSIYNSPVEDSRSPPPPAPPIHTCFPIITSHGAWHKLMASCKRDYLRNWQVGISTIVIKSIAFWSKKHTFFGVIIKSCKCQVPQILHISTFLTNAHELFSLSRAEVIRSVWIQSVMLEYRLFCTSLHQRTSSVDILSFSYQHLKEIRYISLPQSGSYNIYSIDSGIFHHTK